MRARRTHFRFAERRGPTIQRDDPSDHGRSFQGGLQGQAADRGRGEGVQNLGRKMMPAISAETDRISSEAHKQLVLPALPALRGLAKLADLRPVIVVDSREQEPLTFTRLQSVRGTLYSGDYSVRGLEDKFAVERKNLDDIANCCVSGNRDRFEHELHRLRSYRF